MLPARNIYLNANREFLIETFVIFQEAAPAATHVWQCSTHPEQDAIVILKFTY